MKKDITIDTNFYKSVAESIMPCVSREHGDCCFLIDSYDPTGCLLMGKWVKGKPCSAGVCFTHDIEKRKEELGAV